MRFDTYEIPAQGTRIVRDVRVRNVVAVLPGRSPRRIYVSGHYDTVARAVPPRASGALSDTGATAPGPRAASANGGFDWAAGDNPAPGANDDGSGTALTMEAARVLAQSGLEFDATLVFVAFAGEEQGLVGAHLHAQKAVAEKAVIDAVFNNDIIGNSRGGNGIVDAGSVRVFADGPEDSLSRQLARYIRRMAARYVPSHRVRLIARHDRFGRGGDHTAFNQRGYAGVRFSEANENFARQHVVEDTPDGVDAAYLARNTRVNLAGVASLAMAPAAPVDHAASAASRCSIGIRRATTRGCAGRRRRVRRAIASSGARPGRPTGSSSDMWATSPRWSCPIVSIDDYVFGVAAIGPGGHESLVSVYVNPPRTPVEIRTESRRRTLSGAGRAA